jgi:hypothetical protein
MKFPVSSTKKHGAAKGIRMFDFSVNKAGVYEGRAAIYRTYARRK